MPIFIKCNRDGEVLSVSKVDGAIPREVTLPHMQLGADEFSVEVPDDSPNAKLHLLEIHNNHKVDPRTKKLAKKLAVNIPDITLKPPGTP